jgi:hypothetical protein
MILRDALYNADYHSGTDLRYAKGVVVGAVAGMMAVGITFDEAMVRIRAAMPAAPMEGVTPESWL